MASKARTGVTQPKKEAFGGPVAADGGRIAILSDIHSNLQALEAVLLESERRGVTGFCCLGDIVGYGANPGECLRLIKTIDCPTVIGNHDYCVGTGDLDERLNDAAKAGIEYSIAELSGAEREWLAALPATFAGPEFTIVHASLDVPFRWDYISDHDDAWPTLKRQTTPLCFYGHTHIATIFADADYTPTPTLIEPLKYQFHKTGRALLNPGSVGQPRGGDPQARFAIYDSAEMTVEFVAVEYDTEAAALAILAAGLPSYLAGRLIEGV